MAFYALTGALVIVGILLLSWCLGALISFLGGEFELSIENIGDYTLMGLMAGLAIIILIFVCVIVGVLVLGVPS